MQGPDELGPTYGDGAGAPSRPPSRTNNKSPLDPLNGAVDMTMHNATGELDAPLESPLLTFSSNRPGSVSQRR